MKRRGENIDTRRDFTQKPLGAVFFIMT